MQEYGFPLTYIFPYKDRIDCTGKYGLEKIHILANLHNDCDTGNIPVVMLKRVNVCL